MVGAALSTSYSLELTRNFIESNLSLPLYIPPTSTISLTPKTNFQLQLQLMKRCKLLVEFIKSHNTHVRRNCLALNFKRF